MVRSFGVAEKEVGGWAGLCSAVFSISQACMGIPWGRFSDIYGRKTAILLGLSSTMLTSLLWGFSKNLPMALAARILAGAGNGNVGIIRTTVAEMVPFKELQPRAFSLMPLVWNIGSIFGPTIGGALANPLNVKPGQQIDNPSFFQRFPYLLPNLVSACFFAVGILTGLLFLEETLETLQGRRDYGRVVGDKLKGLFKSHIMKIEEILHLRKSQGKVEEDEREPLLKANGHTNEDEEDALPIQPQEPPQPPPKLSEVLNRQSILNLIVYTLLAMHSMAFDQLLPVFMQFPSIHSGSEDVTLPGTDGNPLKFAGGFTLDHFRIGLISTCYGVCGMLIQFFVFPPVARKLGILYCLKWCACVFPIAYFIMPFTALLPTQQTQIAGAFCIMMLKCLCGIFAFPCSTILFTNSASSLRTLGTLNGMATSVSALGRACGPAIGGLFFTIGAKRGFVIAPWWMFSAIAIVAAVPVFFLEEGAGFGGDDGEISDDDEEEEHEADLLRAEGLEGEAEAVASKAGPIMVPTKQQIEEEEEEEQKYGGVGGLLTRTNTGGSTAISEDAESGHGTPERSRRGSASQQLRPTLSRKGSRRIMRRTSMPLGVGSQGVSRRYSSNLGQSLGSAGSYAGY
ncbi:putative membrane protein [Teratosphaeria destructans]|uniref:Membrane protein n=1 Tax=Teratosphaeria destructans TaxID=418781 RepID=A0A9W7W2T6_9PEZI|nr:putative membrane protein [Teratosphaeria destructans]